MPTTDGQPQKSVLDQAKEEYDLRLANGNDMAKAWATDGNTSHEVVRTTAAHMTAQFTAALAAATRLLAAEQARANDFAERMALPPALRGMTITVADQARCEDVAPMSGSRCVRKPDGHRVHKSVTAEGHAVSWSHGSNAEEVTV